MNVKRIIESRIRGWLPQDPILPAHALPNQKKTGRTRIIFLNLLLAFLIIGGLFSALILIDSWIKLVLVGSILIGGIAWRFSHGNVRKVFKFLVVAVLIFSISFTTVEISLLGNSGYPPTYMSDQPNITFSITKIPSVSLTQIVQDIERNPTYKFLTLQFGETTAETIKLHTDFPSHGGLVQVDFYGKNSDAYFYFSSSSGYPYHLNVGISKTTLTTRFHPQAQPAKDSFSQIDDLGLQWFYDRALEIAQNRTGSVPKIDALSFTMTFEDNGYIGPDRIHVSYEGITVQLTGSLNGRGTLIADFEPNGTLIYMTQPH